ncbi:MAG: heterodisulfide reductase-related iron-sulfur binding cluster [Anaerolineae bacterium]
MAETIELMDPTDRPSLWRKDATPHKGYVAAEPPTYEEILRCTHCGLCLNQCPTYRVLGIEADSPRGRIYLMRSVHEGRGDVDADFANHMFVCLACRACETACPATVRFGGLVEMARAQVQAGHLANEPRAARLLRQIVFEQLMPSPGRLEFAAGLTRLYQRSGAQSLVRKSGLLRVLPGDLDKREALMPKLPPKNFKAEGQVYPAIGEKRARVALFNGCIMPLAYGPTQEATVRVLQRNGVEVVVPKDQACCGALAVHAGLREQGKEQAKRNIPVFEALGVDAVIINAAGCGVVLKEYGELLQNDPVWAERAHRFSASVRDVSEFLVDLGLRPPTKEMNVRVTYQDPCHLAHGQGIRLQPRELLRSIPGLELVEMRDSDRCCGSAGIYNITNPDISMRVLDEKMTNVKATNADMIVTANPGCMLQLQAGCERYDYPAEVAHVIDLLDQAYGATG